MNEYPDWKFDNKLLIPWNKGRLIGQKLPLEPLEIWAIRVHYKF